MVLIRLIRDAQNLAILPALLQTAVLALLSASMPLSATMTSILIALTSDGISRTIVPNPGLLEFQNADSVHVLAFTSHGELLLTESEGNFTMDDWDEVYEHARQICGDTGTLADKDAMKDEGFDDGGNGSMMLFVKSVSRAKVESDLQWKAVG